MTLGGPLDFAWNMYYQITVLGVKSHKKLYELSGALAFSGEQDLGVPAHWRGWISWV
jgi:hypothetical protein